MIYPVIQQVSCMLRFKIQGSARIMNFFIYCCIVKKNCLIEFFLTDCHKNAVGPGVIIILLPQTQRS